LSENACHRRRLCKLRRAVQGLLSPVLGRLPLNGYEAFNLQSNRDLSATLNGCSGEADPPI